MADDVTITVRVNNQTAAGFRDINGALRDARGRFAADAGAMTQASNQLRASAGSLKASLISLAPALIPVAAQAAPIAAGLGAAGIAATAFTAAVVPQISKMGEAAKAHAAYEDEVKKSGATSEAAIKKQAEYQRQINEMPKATQRAAASYMVLSDSFKEFSDETSSFTMKPVEQGLQVTTALLPRLTPLARSFSSELTRVTTLAGGAISTPGFDRLADDFTAFTDRTLAGATDAVVHFLRVVSSGDASGPFTEVMQYARENAPAVKETLQALGEALLHVLDASSEVGVGMLQAVGVIADLVSAVPAPALATFMQLALAIKAVSLASAGLGAGRALLVGFTAQIIAANTAAAAAPGRLAAMRAAVMALSTTTKAAMAGTGLGLAVLAIGAIAESSRNAPPDVDKLTSSLRDLGSTGKVTGEAARAFGSDLSGLHDKVSALTDPSNAEKVQQFLVGWTGWDSTPVKTAKENLDSVDKSLAGLVKDGKADLAAAALKKLTAEYGKGGRDTKEFTSQLNDYKSALADQKFEQQLAAESMGVFGAQAQAASEKLAAQKASADGLRQSIEALNDVNRAALGGMIGFEASIDAAQKAARENAGALNMVGGQLDLNSPKAQAAAGALNDLATKTKDAAASARESGASWERVNGIYTRGRDAFIANAQAMGLSKREAQQLAAEIMKIPSGKKLKVEMATEDAVAGLNSVIAAMRKTPNSKSVTVKTLSGSAIKALENVGFKTKRLPDGRVTVTARTGTALSNIGAVQGARDRLTGKTITITTRRVEVFEIRKTTSSVADAINRQAANARNRRAFGGPIRKYAAGGDVQAIPNGGYIQGPGSGTSDSIFAMFGSGATGMVSNTEFVVQASAVRKYGVALLDKLNQGRLKIAGFARGGVTKSERDARNSARGELTISHFGTMAGYRNTEIRNALARPDSMGPLVSALNQWRSVIMKSTHGSQERGLLRMLDNYGRSLIRHERALTKVNDQLDKAKSKLSDLKSAASQLASSVKSGVLSSANITKGASGDAPVTVRSIMGGLTASRDKASSFSKALAGLKKKGLSSTLLQQIAEAGIEGGGLETAGALLGASKSEIGQLNKLQGQIGASAKSAGTITSDAVYGAQIKTSQALVTTLTKQQTRLEKSMDKLAAAIERSLRRAIGGKWTGGITGAATGGARGGLTWVGEDGPKLARLPFGSRVYPAHTSRRMVAEAAGGGQPLMVVLTLDGVVLARQLVDPLRGEIRVRGGNVQRALGVGA